MDEATTNTQSNTGLPPVPAEAPQVTERLMSGPAGLDLNPAPPKATRLNKKVGLMGALGVFMVIMLIIFGIYSRGQKNKAGAARKGDDGKSITAATTAGTNLLNDLQQKHANSAKESLEATGAEAGAEAAGAAPSVPQSGDQLVPPLGVRSTDVPHLPERAPGLINQSSGRVRSVAGGGGGAGLMGRSAAQKEREEMYKMEMAAMNAPTTIGSGGAASMASAGPLGRLASAVGDPIGGLLSQARSMLGGGAQISPASAVSVAGVGGGQHEDPNMQNQKEAFVATARNNPSQKDYLAAVREAQITRYVVRAGWDIPATLEQKVNSDLPGEIRALVRENVYDTATGRYLLIPQGARVIGRYDSHIAYGQSRVQVIWDRLIFPDGSSIDLGGMIGQDANGASGFHDKVDHHYVRMFGMALLTSAFSAGIQMTQGNQTSSPYGYPSNQQIAVQALGQQMGQLGMDITEKNLNVQPTIKIPIGYRFNIRINRDMAFTAPYSPMN